MERSRIRIPAFSVLCNDPGIVHMGPTNQYNLVLAKWRWCSEAGTVTGRKVMAAYRRVGRWSNFLDPTKPDPQVKWPNPTRPVSELAWNSGPDPARPIYAGLIFLPSAVESFSLSTKWLFIRCQHHRITSHCLLSKHHVLNVGITN